MPGRISANDVGSMPYSSGGRPATALSADVRHLCPCTARRRAVGVGDELGRHVPVLGRQSPLEQVGRLDHVVVDAHQDHVVEIHRRSLSCESADCGATDPAAPAVIEVTIAIYITITTDRWASRALASVTGSPRGQRPLGSDTLSTSGRLPTHRRGAPREALSVLKSHFSPPVPTAGRSPEAPDVSAAGST